MTPFKKIRNNLPLFVYSLRLKRKIYTKKAVVYIKRYPYRSLFLTLLFFLLVMTVGNLFFAPRPEKTENAVVVKAVKIYNIGSAPEISYQGKIEKSGVIKIVAQTSGIVQNINVYEGEEIGKGTNILSLSSNYSGGNALSVARQIAGTQYQSAKDTYDTQKDLITKQREVANKNQDNATLLKSIIADSATSTQNLAYLDQSIVDSIKANIDTLVATNVGGINDAAILQSKEALSQFQAALVQTTSSYKNLQVQSNSNSSDIASLQHDIALKQLDLQEKALQMTLNIAGLQLRMAQINEANMFPSSPFSGTVNKIFVHLGDSVNPGTLLTQISGDSQHAEVVVNIPDRIARNISNFQPSTLHFQHQTIHMMPTFVSKDATNGTLYSIIYDLSDLSVTNLTDQAYVEVSVPIGVADTTNEDPFVPLDAVVQTQEEAFVYVQDSKNIARVKKVVLGEIQGRYVEVLTGLPKDARVILDRNVIDGDKVSASK